MAALIRFYLESEFSEGETIALQYASAKTEPSTFQQALAAVDVPDLLTLLAHCRSCKKISAFFKDMSFLLQFESRSLPSGQQQVRDRTLSKRAVGQAFYKK